MINGRQTKGRIKVSLSLSLQQKNKRKKEKKKTFSVLFLFLCSQTRKEDKRENGRDDREGRRVQTSRGRNGKRRLERKKELQFY